MRLLASILMILIATYAGGAECGNCGGDRVVGEPPIRFACPVCEGTGTTASATAEVAEVKVAAALPAPAGAPRPVVARVESSEGPSRCSGSGVLVSASGSTGVVLTNWHVVRTHRDEITVHWPDGTSSRAKVLASDDAWDLAALQVPRPAAVPVPIAASAPRIGERLTIAGYGPAPYQYREESGKCTDYGAPTASHPREFVELSATARKGDSGGPIFDARGELAGVLFGSRPGLTVGPCSSRLRQFLATVPETPPAAPQLAAAPAPAKASTCPNGRCPKR